MSRQLEELLAAMGERVGEGVVEEPEHKEVKCSPEVTLVVGKQGVGKTRLIRSLLQKSQFQTVIVLTNTPEKYKDYALVGALSNEQLVKAVRSVPPNSCVVVDDELGVTHVYPSTWRTVFLGGSNCTLIVSTSSFSYVQQQLFENVKDMWYRGCEDKLVRSRMFYNTAKDSYENIFHQPVVFLNACKGELQGVRDLSEEPEPCDLTDKLALIKPFANRDLVKSISDTDDASLLARREFQSRWAATVPGMTAKLGMDAVPQ